MDERRERPFGQLVREGVRRVVSEVDSFSRKFVSFIVHHPLESALLAIGVPLGIADFYWGIEGMKEPVWSPLTRGVAGVTAAGIALSPFLLAIASANHSQRR